MKRLTLLFLLCAATIISRAYDFEIDGIYYYIQSSADLTVGVTYKGNYPDSYSNEYSGQITIPETVNYNGNTYHVTAIGAAFYNCKNLISVTIPNSITSIGSDAFCYCEGLTSITIPNSVTSIGSHAFYSCSNLTSISIPGNITSIGSDAFDDTPWYKKQPNGLVYAGNMLYAYKGTMPENTSIVIKEGTIGIANGAFEGYKNLLSVTIPKSVISIGNSTFERCENLGAIIIPEGVTSIGSTAFYNCSNLVAISVPRSLTSIGRLAFNGTAWYNNQPDGVIYIGNILYAYKGDMQENTSIEIKEGTVGIAAEAFANNYSQLTSIVIPKSLKSIGDNAFLSAVSTQASIHISSIEAWCNIDFKDADSNPCRRYGDYATKLYLNGKLITELTIPNSVTVIKDYSFESCGGITSINIPESVTSIGQQAFNNCKDLISINIPKGITSIGDYAFYNCNNLSTISIPKGVTSIGDYAFYGCSNIASINIPQSVTSIGDYAFYGCSNIASITIPPSITSIGDYAFSDCTNLASINIPEGVISIGQYAFKGCSNLTHITIPQSITSIGDYAFSEFSSLTSINIPEGVTSIGKFAFYDCKNLKSINIPKSVTSIGEYAFSGCNSLASIRIPNVTSIEAGTFANCKSFTSATIPESVNSIGNYAFSGCSNLTLINIPNNVTTIKYETFSGCSNLSSITIPESITSIEGYAFHDCSSLTSITIPRNITSIHTTAFSNCNNLTAIIVEEDNSAYDSRDNCNAIINTAHNQLVIGCPSTIIPQSVTSIGSYAFSDCCGLTSITIPESITRIEDFAFSGCIGLTSISIPSSTTYIGYNTFLNCNNLTSIVVEKENAIYDSRNDCNAIIETRTRNLLYGCATTIIPEDVTSIGNNAFYGCSDLTSITIPENMTSIGYGAFSGCTGLKNLVIPKNIKSIGSDAFRDCLFQSLLLYCRNLNSYSDYSLNSKSTIYAYKTEIPLIQKRNSCNYVALDEPYTIKDCKSYIHGVDFNLAGNSLFENNVELLSIEVGGQSIAINDSNKYEVYGLDENTQYDIKVTCKVNDSIYNITEEITTKNISVASYIAEKTNKTMSIYVRANQDKTCSADEMGFLFNGKEYKYSGDNVLISNLTPNESYTISPYAYYGAKKVVGADKTVSTYGLEPKMSTLKLTPTTYQAYGHYKIIDACISETGFTNHTEGDVLTLTGLDPSTKYTIEYYVKTKEGSNEKVTTTFTTPALEMTTLNPKVVSNSCAIVAATTNMSDEETNAGFQWRKYEAPETLPSSEGYAAIYDGQLEGYIKNLQATSFYNVRAFYKSTAGKYYYSDWVTFDPSDFSYFEPTVHTYPTEELTANSAKVKGYVLQGTDAITEQGFVYWPTGTNKANATRSVTVPENASIVIAKGQVMNVTLEGLTPSTTYNFCAFVTTASGTIYGEEHSFTTKADETGIESLESEQPTPSIIGYYDLNGRKLSEPQHGITIVRYSDGTARKILTE